MMLRSLGFASLGFMVLTGTAAQARSTMAHAMITSGQAGHPGGGFFDCATSGPQSTMSSRFNTGIGLPTEGYAYCGLAGGIDNQSSATGVSTAHEDLGPAGHGVNYGVHYQKADAIADFGVLKASSNGSYTGESGGGFLYTAGEGAAIVTDTLATPAAAKFIQLSFTVDGSASVAKSSQILAIFNYQINSGPIYTIFSAGLLGSGAYARGLHGSDMVDLTGFTTTAGSLSGSDTVYTYRTELPDAPDFDLSLSLYVGSYPSPLGGAAIGDFAHTVRLSSIAAFDASGRQCPGLWQHPRCIRAQL